MFDDVIKTIKAQLYDRVTSPLFGTFLMSWLGWNWHLPVLFVFDSSTHVIDKFSYVSSTLYPEQSTYWLQGFIYPLLTTAFFIGIYPWLARPVYGYWRSQQKKQKELQQKFDDETPLTVEEARELRREILLSEIKYQTESEQRESRIKDLEGIIKSLGEKSEERNDPYLSGNTKVEQIVPAKNKKNRSDETIKGMLQTLMELNKDPGGTSRSAFTANMSPDDRLKKEHYIDQLLEDGLIRQNLGKIYINPTGRTALLNSGL